MANKKAISDEEIISALLQHSTISEAAAAVGLSTRAIYDRMESREFRSKYLWAKQDIIRSAVFSVNAKLSDAVDTIAEIMADPGNNPAIRLQAAKMILDNAGKFAERLASEENQSRREAKDPLIAAWD